MSVTLFEAFQLERLGVLHHAELELTGKISPDAQGLIFCERAAVELQGTGSIVGGF